MNSRRLFVGLLGGAIGLSLAISGCSGKKAVTAPKANQRPLLELTRAPFNESTRFEYSYRMNWLGYDPDGRVEYYLYAIDPPARTPQNPEPETTWVQTDKSERLVNFSATKPDSSNPSVDGSSDFHTFVVKAIDNGGLGGPLQSAPLIRSFFTYTIAPTVQILDPPPTDRSRTYTPPSVRITWAGTDEDGILNNKKPNKYKFILLTQNSEVPFQVAKDFPDSVRRYYAPRNWAGWDSTSADTTTHQFTDLVPGQDYMFVVVAFDEAGAYSPVFSRNSNMLELRITFAASGGPTLTIFNEYFFYEYVAPVYAPTIDRYIAKVEVPAGRPVTFNWTAVASPGAIVRGYRWALDIDDVSDQTPRTNERTDVTHWSQESALGTTATVGPFGGGESHRFYIEAADNNGLKSLGVVQFFVVQSNLGDTDPITPGIEQPLLIVDDTRLKVDQRSGSQSCMNPPPSGTRWPVAAELDTFLYARGGFPYKCYPAGTISRPGLFSGYKFDTVGTRTGQSVVRVPLAKLGAYQHVIWLTDQQGALQDNPGTDVANSVTALRYMSRPGQANSLAAYVQQGGKVWLAGGGGGYATNIPYNKPANDLNIPASPTFSFIENELVPGRFMYDIMKWQSEFKSTSGPIRVLRNRARHDSALAVPAAYANLPAEMRPHTRGVDSLPPLRNSSDYFYSTFEVEYLSQQNRILEDVDPSLLGFDEQSTLDTLYYATGQVLVAPQFNRYNVCMTRYVGPGYPQPIIFTGFNFWAWSKADCQALLDAVLHDMWGLNRSAAPLAARSLGSSTASSAWAPVKMATTSTAPLAPIRSSRAGR